MIQLEPKKLRKYGKSQTTLRHTHPTTVLCKNSSTYHPSWTHNLDRGKPLLAITTPHITHLFGRIHGLVAPMASRRPSVWMHLERVTVKQTSSNTTTARLLGISSSTGIVSPSFVKHVCKTSQLHTLYKLTWSCI